MNIGIIGAPGSGKSKLAEELAVSLSGSSVIVDDYVESIEEDSDIAISQVTDYLGNLLVAMTRYTDERYARSRYDNVITCGTLIETAVYYAMHIDSVTRVITEEEKASYAVRADAMMRMLSCLYADTVSYDHVFFLPSEDGGEDVKFMDTQIQAALGGFKLFDATILPPTDRVAAALKVL